MDYSKDLPRKNPRVGLGHYYPKTNGYATIAWVGLADWLLRLCLGCQIERMRLALGSSFQSPLAAGQAAFWQLTF
jgi:hypothetical protein